MFVRKPVHFIWFVVLVVMVVALSACGNGNLPKPPAGAGGAMPQVPESKPTLPAVPSMPAVTMPAMPSSVPGGTEMSTEAPVAAPTPDWATVKTQAAAIQQQATKLQEGYQDIANSAAWIQQHETDEDVLALAGQIAELASQAEQDAAQLAVTADEINYRIDHSEGTTLRLSDDIGEMADRIGEMADRILWTEEQIGVMADRIVHSEHLINDGTQQTIDQIQESLKTLDAFVNEVLEKSTEIRQQTAPPTADAANGENGTGSSNGNGNGNGNGGNASGGAGIGTAGVSGGATATETAADRSPRRLEVLSRSIYLNASALQSSLHTAKENAIALGADELTASLSQAEQTAAQIALAGDDLNAHAKVADVLTADLIARGQQAYAQIQAALQNLNAALAQAEAAAQALPADDAKAQETRRILEAGRITSEYITRWNAEIATIVGQ